MGMILLKRNSILHLNRCRVDLNLDAHRFQCRHEMLIKVSNRTRHQRQIFPLSIAGKYGKIVVDEIKRDLEGTCRSRDERCRQSPRGYRKTHFPPLVEERAQL